MSARQSHLDQPGSAAWHGRRDRCWNAGDAAAMLGCSPNKARSVLLQEMATGIKQEFSDYVQDRVIDPGHRIEELCRPLAEEILDEDLTVLAFSLAVAGLSRPLGASLDGITFLEDIIWENKSINDELRAALPHAGRDSHQHNDGKALPKDKRVQMESQLLVTGAGKALFSAAKFKQNGEVEEERHAWYYPDPDLRAEIIEGWRVFEEDLANYKPVEVLEKMAPIGRTPEQLPVLRATVTGTLVLDSTIKEWESAALAFIKNVRDHELKTDADFADADAAATWCVTSKTTLQGLKAQLMSATGDVNAAVATLDRISAELDKTRISFANAIKARKDARKAEIVATGISALRKHETALNERWDQPYLPLTSDAKLAEIFGAAVKGRSSFAKMEEEVRTTLNTAKIDANRKSYAIDANLAHLLKLGDEYSSLFPDKRTLVAAKAPEDFSAIADLRVTNHKQQEQLRKLREEEAERVRAVAATPAPTEAPTPAPTAAPAAATPSSASQAEADPFATVQVVMPGGAVGRVPASSVQYVARPPAQDEKRSLKLGDINGRLGLVMTGAFVKQLGVPGAAGERGAILFSEREFDSVCEALIAHIRTVQHKAKEPALA